MTTVHKSGGELIVECLKAQAVERVFCVPGESYLPVLDALYDTDIEITVCRQEGGAAMMAEAWGKLTGSPGVCLVTRGPGASNAASGIHVAAQDSTPLILFVGQIHSATRHREAFQELDYCQVFSSIAKWVAEIDHVARIPEFVMRAWQTAVNGRPGPVVLALPEDTLTDSALPGAVKRVCATETYPNPSQLDQLQHTLASAQRPIAIVGGSRWSVQATDALMRFSNSTGLPVATSFRRQMLFDHLHPNFAGDVGIGINPKLRARVNDADVVLLIGGRLPEIPAQGYTLLDVPCPSQNLIHIHPGAEEIGRVYQPHLGIQCSPTAFCDVLESITTDANWHDLGAAAHKEYLDWSSLHHVHEKAELMKTVMQYLKDTLSEDAIITNGAGNYCGWIHRFYPFRRFGTQLAPTSGSMGYGFPAAVAAKLAHPDKTVIAFAGDGCFQMTFQEFGTAVQSGAAVIVLVIDNGMYGTIRMHQEKNYPGRISATELLNPDFSAWARAYGGFGATVNQPDEFASAFTKALASNLPAIIHLRIDPEVITPSQLLSEI